MTKDKQADAKREKFYEQKSAYPDSAMPEFMAHEMFGDLLPQSLDPYYLHHLAVRTAAAWVWGNLRDWKLRVVVGLELLSRVPSGHFQRFRDVVSHIMQSYYGPQKAAFYRRRDRREKEEREEPEVRFVPLLNQYLHDFEGLYGHIATVFAFAKDALFGGLHANNGVEWWVRQSAKTKASKLNNTVSLKSGPIFALIEGYDRHFRNAIAHSRFRFVDSETVEMWDVNEKGKETWRSRFSYETCEEKVENLDATIMAMEGAYFLFVIRNYQVLKSNSASAIRLPATPEEREALIYEVARFNYQLEITEMKEDPSQLFLRAKLIPNFDIPQVSEVIVGGPGGASAFEVEIKVFEVELQRVVFGFLRTLEAMLQNIRAVSLEVTDYKGAELGRVRMNEEQVKNLTAVDDKVFPADWLPCEENSLRKNVLVKFTRRGKPKPKIRKASRIILPPDKRIIIP